MDQDHSSGEVAGLCRERDRLLEERDRLVQQVAELESENVRLRELAGLASRELAAEGAAEPRLFRVSPLPEVDATSDATDKLALLRRLFRALSGRGAALSSRRPASEAGSNGPYTTEG